MPTNDSSTGGYLQPSPAPAPQPLQGQSFQDWLQQIIVGITGLPGPSVVPRWQLEPPDLPDVGTDWAAFGIIETIPDTFAAIIHNPTGQGDDTFQRHELVKLLVSFYGPDADSYCALLRDGLQVAQNREVMFLASVGHVETGNPQAVPSLVQNQWLYRVDIPWTVKRRVLRNYPILNLLIGQGTIISDIPQTEPFTVTSSYTPPR
jgi:hypothetical protein